jgi:hypothetical protein
MCSLWPIRCSDCVEGEKKAILVELDSAVLQRKEGDITSGYLSRDK